MRVIIYDTETTGLPEKHATSTDYEQHPHIVQLSYLVYNITEEQMHGPLSAISPIAMADYIIRPNGYEIPIEAAQIHGITQAIALRDGTDLKIAMADFLSQIAMANVIVAHNSLFDKNVVHAAMFRLGMFSESGRHTWTTLPDVKEICTMCTTTALCRLPFALRAGAVETPYPNNNQTKWPRLSELFQTLFPHEPLPLSLHNSLVDVRVTARCFFALVDSAVIVL